MQQIFAVQLQAHKNLACAAKMQKNVTVANLLLYLLLTQVNYIIEEKFHPAAVNICGITTWC